MNNYYFGVNSKKNMKGVHPRLILLMGYALATSPIDFGVREGVRSDRRQLELYKVGRKQVEGKWVLTGECKPVTKTLNSNHKKNKVTGYGHAVDIYPTNYKGDKDKRWDPLISHVKKCAKILKIDIRCGHSWGWDSPHIELAKSYGQK